MRDREVATHGPPIYAAAVRLGAPSSRQATSGVSSSSCSTKLTRQNARLLRSSSAGCTHSAPKASARLPPGQQRHTGVGGLATEPDAEGR